MCRDRGLHIMCGRVADAEEHRLATSYLCVRRGGDICVSVCCSDTPPSLPEVVCMLCLLVYAVCAVCELCGPGCFVTDVLLFVAIGDSCWIGYTCWS